MMRSLPTLSLFVLIATACSGGGGGSSTPTTGPIRPPTTPPVAPSAQQSGIRAAAAGSGEVRLDIALPGTGFEAALFQGTSPTSIYGTTPVVTGILTSPVLLTGLTDGIDTFFGLAIRATGTTAWTPVGTVVRTRPAAPIYVDATANPNTANGTSPATAFPNLQDALLVAGSLNGGNVWVRDGEYANGPYSLGANVHLAGGFDGTFALATRDVAAGATQLVGSATLQIVEVIGGGSDGTIDGLLIDGRNTVTEGIDITDSDVELRALSVRRCTDRGVRAKVTVPTPNRHLQVVACTITENGSDGLSSAGPIDLRFDLSQFDANGQEGADIDNLEAPSGGEVSLVATGCRFFGNVFEGLDADLAAAPLATTPGTFHVLLENCAFEQNGLDGLLLDQEHEFAPGFAATIAVRGCIARANRLAGVHIDADAEGTYRLERLRCTANATDGVLVTSETNAGEVVLTASWLAGNLGYGARAGTGNKTLLASHCGFAGNQLGGLRSENVTASAVDCIALGQVSLLTSAIGAANVVAAAAEDVFVRAPRAFALASAHSQGSVTVASVTGFALGNNVVAADDGRRLVVNQITGSTLVLDRAPQAFTAPGSLAAYATSNVTDDLRLATASPAIAAGITPPGTTAPDCGPFGPSAGGAPGHIEPTAITTLQLLSIEPPLATGLTPTTALVLTFDRDIDPASALPDRIQVLRNNGITIAAGIQVSGRTLTLAPPATGWTAPLRLQLHAGLAAQDGSPLGAPLLLPLRIL